MVWRFGQRPGPQPTGAAAEGFGGGCLEPQPKMAWH